jgi:hypothetical protein
MSSHLCRWADHGQCRATAGRMMAADEVAVDAGVTWAAVAVPRHYVSADEIAAVLRELGKPEAAAVLSGKLPVNNRTRSGELGEILGTQYAARELGYRMIARLRWKDSRDMPMRGDDLLGVHMVDDDKLEFLKGEAKSRASLSTSTLDEAETALLSEHGLPTPHALMSVAARLRALRADRDRSRTHLRPSRQDHLILVRHHRGQRCRRKHPPGPRHCGLDSREARLRPPQRS